jgi:di- and tripeptidase
MVIEKFLNDSFASLDSPNNLEIAFAISADPWLGDPTNHAFQVLRKAISDEWGTDPIFIREGGSIPVVRRLERMLRAPAAQLPCGQASDGAHLNNERLRISNFFKTRQIIKRAFAELRPRSV